MVVRKPLPLAIVAAATVTAVAALTTVSITARAATPATAPAEARSSTAVQADLKADESAFESAMTSPEVLTDPAARKAAAPKLVPAAKKLYADLMQYAADQQQPEAKQQIEAKADQLNTILVAFGDTDATARLKARADSKDAAVATDAKGDQLLAEWWNDAKDPAAQAKVAESATALAKAHPESDSLTGTLMLMSQMGASSPDLAKQMQGLIVDVMKNPTAEQIQPQLAADRKLAELVGKPMTIKGTTVDGKAFTTADWKGKVILVDNWATWCGPCRAELPHVQKMYDEYHPKGLEIVGISNDQSGDDLKAFLKANPKMAWPELFDAAAAAKGEWNPLTTGFGIQGIPTMFLIDKHGVCRTVEAREQMDEMIPKLLAGQ